MIRQLSGAFSPIGLEISQSSRQARGNDSGAPPDRNRSWMPRLAELIHGNQTDFVAVGAGHLVGPGGVVALLRKAGYQADRL
ncbi:TraB/GumN family protein [Bryocella elongata]|uniref:TraB/GumN family protein n=1 Tax=Bryocella elongata TaxID=863522 RepID=UPI000CDEDC68|nr:TraB/GumN family protein [Bryocella elongata]